MGNICTNNFEKQENTETVDTYKNSIQYEVQLGENCILSMIFGHYRQQRSDAILTFVQLRHIKHCDPLQDYTSDPDKTIEIITNMRKSFYKAPVIKSSPYKKLLICILPTYSSEDREAYIQQLKNVLNEAFQTSKDITIELSNTMQNINCLPNQLILSILYKELIAIQRPIKLNLVATEKKMMHLYKFEVQKTESYKVRVKRE